MADTINFSDTQKLRLNELELERKTLEMVMGSRQDKKTSNVSDVDSYHKGNSESCLYLNYTEEATLSQNQPGISKEDIWKYLSDFDGIITNGEFSVNGQKCYTSQIQKIGKEMLQKPLAIDNVLTLNTGVYYGITTNDGGKDTTWSLSVGSAGGLDVSGSESFYASQHKITLKEIGDWSRIFRFLAPAGKSAGAGIYIGQPNAGKVKEMIDNLGFKPGLCTIRIKGKDNTFYYSNNGRIYPQYEYDGIYEGLTNYNNLFNYEVGDTFNYNGNKYQVDELGHVNVPYGEDLFNCVSRPEGKLAKEFKNRQVQ